MKKVGLVALLLILVLTLAPINAGCLAWGAPEVHALPSGTDYLADTYGRYTKEVMPGWILGVVYQSSWIESHGLHSDKYNKVRLLVYVPQGTLTIIPRDPRQEEKFAKTYEAGDAIAFRFWDETNRDWYRGAMYPSGPIRVWFDDVMVIAKGAAKK